MVVEVEEAVVAVVAAAVGSSSTHLDPVEIPDIASRPVGV